VKHKPKFARIVEPKVNPPQTDRKINPARGARAKNGRSWGRILP
jgi:hypothetical protein